MNRQQYVRRQAEAHRLVHDLITTAALGDEKTMRKLIADMDQRQLRDVLYHLAFFTPAIADIAAGRRYDIGHALTAADLFMSTHEREDCPEHGICLRHHGGDA